MCDYTSACEDFTFTHELCSLNPLLYVRSPGPCRDNAAAVHASFTFDRPSGFCCPFPSIQPASQLLHHTNLAQPLVHMLGFNFKCATCDFPLVLVNFQVSVCSRFLSSFCFIDC